MLTLYTLYIYPKYSSRSTVVQQFEWSVYCTLWFSFAVSVAWLDLVFLFSFWGRKTKWCDQIDWESSEVFLAWALKCNELTINSRQKLDNCDESKAKQKKKHTRNRNKRWKLNKWKNRWKSEMEKWFWNLLFVFVSWLLVWFNTDLLCVSSFQYWMLNYTQFLVRNSNEREKRVRVKIESERIKTFLRVNNGIVWTRIDPLFPVYIIFWWVCKCAIVPFIKLSCVVRCTFPKKSRFQNAPQTL